MSPVLALPVGPRDHMRGPRDAPVTVVEYADAQCPYCGRLEPLLQEVMTRRGDVRLVYRHYPLVDVHPFAYSAALAMEAAGAAGLFWELHDRLFADQDALGRANLARHAEALGLAGESVLRPASGAWDQRVRDDFDSGVASGVEGTPGLFLNGVRYEGRLKIDSLDAAVESALAAVSGRP
ncbi:MAG: DsbA family protein [Actinomycetota bacterium]|nr:DsbA family protein [Actinomycetota bacterium]